MQLCSCDYVFDKSDKIIPGRAKDERGKETSAEEVDIFQEYLGFALLSGSISGIISYFAVRNFELPVFAPWIACYIVFMRNLHPFARMLAIFITIALTFRGDAIWQLLRVLLSN